jgi:hypothetical protein
MYLSEEPLLGVDWSLTLIDSTIFAISKEFPFHLKIFALNQEANKLELREINLLESLEKAEQSFVSDTKTLNIEQVLDVFFIDRIVFLRIFLQNPLQSQRILLISAECDVGDHLKNPSREVFSFKYLDASFEMKYAARVANEYRESTVLVSDGKDWFEIHDTEFLTLRREEIFKYEELPEAAYDKKSLISTPMLDGDNGELRFEVI